MAGQQTVYFVTYVDPPGAGGGNPSAAAGHLPPPYAGPGPQQGVRPAPPYHGSGVPHDQGRLPTAPAYDSVVPGVQQFHRPGPTPLPQRVPNGQQHQQHQQHQHQPQQQSWQQLQQQQWQQRGYAPPAYPVVKGNDDGAGAQAASKAGDGVAAVAKENRRRKWAMFVLGNVISFAVVVSEISELGVCFEENLDDDDDELPEDNAASAYGWMLFTLVLGLWVDVFSAVTLSVIYGSPLDIKSVHKIPAGDMRHCGGTIMVNFLAPFSWCLIYFSGGLVSVYYGQNAPCGGRYGGSTLESYLYASAAMMFLFSLAMLILSGVMLLLACISCPQRTAAQNADPSGPGQSRRPGCCTRIREKIYTKVLSKSPIFDLGWQLQGVILSYRAGAFGLLTAVLVGSAGVFGELLAAFGSLAPVAVEELLGPVMV